MRCNFAYNVSIAIYGAKIVATCSARECMDTYDSGRKRSLGEYLSRFYEDRSLWPAGLEAWYEQRRKTLTNYQKGKGLSVALLLEWMSEQTQIPECSSRQKRIFFS